MFVFINALAFEYSYSPSFFTSLLFLSHSRHKNYTLCDPCYQARSRMRCASCRMKTHSKTGNKELVSCSTCPRYVSCSRDGQVVGCCIV